ncbi:hypothetical protein BH11PLA2_BH11PLA2_07310 [soil metagenome]
MDAQSLIERILDDEALTGELDSDAATHLVDWLTSHAEAIAKSGTTADLARKRVDALCKVARGIAKDGDTLEVLKTKLAAVKESA